MIIFSAFGTDLCLETCLQSVPGVSNKFIQRPSNAIFRITWDWCLKRCAGIICSVMQTLCLFYSVRSVNGGGTDSKERKEVQIDIVGTPVDGNEYIIGSCKYKNEKIGVDELELIRHYASVFGRGNKYHYFIFSKVGFSSALEALGKQGEDYAPYSGGYIYIRT